MSCPTRPELFEALESPTAEARLLAHLATGCEPCERRWALVRRVLAAEGAGRLPAVPARLARAAAAVPRISGAGSPGLRVRVASLVRDLLGGTPVPAIRGADLGERHLLFRAGPFDVDLAVLSSESLVGQVIAADPEADRFEDATCFLYGGGEPRAVPLEASGEFQFDALAPGVYELVIETPRDQILLPGVDLSAEEQGEHP